MQNLVKPIVFLVCCLSIGASATAGTNALLGTSTLAQPDEAMWKRVQRLEPGVRVKVTLSGAAAVERYFVQLNDRELIVLNLTDGNLPKRQILGMAADNPAWIAATSKTTFRDNNLRIGPDGVFLKDQKLADLGQVVEHIPRDRIAAVAKA